MSARRRPTSADVARRAGVSRATVSYVLNDQPGQSIPTATRERVHEAARDLGYTPNAAAKALRAGQSNLVLLAVRNIPYGRNLGIVVDRLAEQVAARGLTLVIWEPAMGQSLRTTLGHLQPRYAMSLLQLEQDEIAALRVANVPYAASESAGVSLRDELTGSLQVHHLAERGHRRIGYLGTEDSEVFVFSGPRRTGVRRGCLELDLPAPAEASVPLPPKGRIEEVVEILRAWHREGVTAVAAYNDYLAGQCLRAAAQLGLRVPEDLAVIGVDDDPMSALLEPALTTVSIDMVGLADHLLGTVLQLSGEVEEAPAHVASESIRVVDRAST